MSQDLQSRSERAMVNRRRDELDIAHDFLDYLTAYAREKPEVIAMWCFGIGFVLGWKLKPW